MAMRVKLARDFTKNAHKGALNPYFSFRYYFADENYDPFNYEPFQLPVWSSTSFAFDYAGVCVPTVSNGHHYVSVSWDGSNPTGALEPTWPTDGSTVVDGGITWKDAGTIYPAENIERGNIFWAGVTPGNFIAGFCPSDVWTALTGYTVQQDFVHKVTNDGQVYICTKSGVSGASEPTWTQSTSTVITDGTVEWRWVGYNPGAWAMPSTGSYDFSTGLPGTGFSYEANYFSWNDDYKVLVPMHLDDIVGLDTSGWQGLNVKYMFVCSGLNPFETGPTGIWTDKINPFILCVDLDDNVPSGIPVVEPSGELNVRWYQFGFGGPADRGLAYEFDNSKY